MKKTILIIFSFAALIGIGIGVYFIYSVYGKNVDLGKEEKLITIYPKTTYKGVKQQLLDSSIISSELSFDVVSKFMGYNDGKIKPGKYLIKNGWNNRELIGILRGGYQTPVNVTFNNARKIENLAGQLSAYVLADSMEFLQYFRSNDFLSTNNVNDTIALALFIPNTYEMYWTSSPENVADKLIEEYKKFWSSNEREQKAKEKGLSKNEIYTLASIVEKETNYQPERPRMAGVYLNRLEKGIPLQADPTVVYAVGDFTIRRVLNSHLEYDSPYNTYMYAGLPPGPITMPSISAIDAVLNAEDHNYMYFCAKPGYNSEHLFAKTLRQHNVNANKYRRWLNQEGIR